MRSAFDRALELRDLTLADPRWRDRLCEIARVRELLCAAALGEPAYGTTLEDLDRYLLAFAVAARNSRPPSPSPSLRERVTSETLAPAGGEGVISKPSPPEGERAG
jgi:hypothetical protein